MTSAEIEEDAPEAQAGTEIERVRAAVASALERLVGRRLAPGLYLVATPIGNLGDITLRALATLAAADIVYCEDTRHSRTLFAHFGLRPTTRPYHDHNADAERPRILAALADGKAIALVSDAGTPLVSDPGFKLVREAAAAGHAVVAIPGASALLAALSVAAQPTDAVLFAGFLPAKEAARRTRIAELARVAATLVLFEAPGRLAAALSDLAAGLGDREACVARELTKLHEDVRRAPLTRLAAELTGEQLKGEIAIVVAPPTEAEASDDAILTMLAPALASMSVRDAARAVADALAVPRARVYDLALATKREGGPDG